MRRIPNPWIAAPSLLLGLLSGALGWVVTDLSCRRPAPGGGYTTCTGWMVLVGFASFAVATLGTAVILALAYRSLAEWREKAGDGF